MRLRVSSVAFSPDGEILASAEENGVVYLWDGVTGRHKRTLAGHTNWVHRRHVQSGWKDVGKWERRSDHPSLGCRYRCTEANNQAYVFCW